MCLKTVLYLPVATLRQIMLCTSLASLETIGGAFMGLLVN
jgi:hypothetical protein